jgi:uncharacterized membrane protein
MKFINKIKPENVFIVLASIFGLIFLFVVPPIQVPDELAHFNKAYQVSEGKFFGEVQGKLAGDYLPESLNLFGATLLSQGIYSHPEIKQSIPMLMAELSRPLNPGKQAFVDFRGALLYSPVPYLPQAFGIALGRLLSLPPIILFYLGRLFNLAVWIALIQLAIRWVPLHKWVWVLLALAPMSLFLSASLSADAPTNALAFLLIAVTLKFAFVGDEPLQNKDLALLFTVGILLALSKQAYLLLSGLVLLIPIKRFGSLRRKLMISLIFIALCVAASLGWTWLGRHLFVPNRVGAGVSPHGQLVYLLKYPGQIFNVLSKTYYSYFAFYLDSWVGVLGWLDTRLPDYFYTIFEGIVLAVALVDMQVQYQFKISQRLLIAATFLAGVGFILGTSYIFFTPIGKGRILGVQGRYFIPLMPLFLLLLYNHRLRLPRAILVGVVTLFALLVLALTTQVLIIRYYVPV